VLRNQGAQFDAECYDEEEPVEKDDAVRVSQSRMLEPLDFEYDAQGEDCENTGPEADIAGPYVGVADNLDDQL